MPPIRFALIALTVAGCATAPKPPSVEPAVYKAVVDRAAAQVKSCYRTPRVASSGKQISTRLLIRLREDGGLAALPEVISQAGVTPDNSAYAGKMAEAAGLAVMRCAPLRLPRELYRGWSVLELNFSPSRRA